MEFLIGSDRFLVTFHARANRGVPIFINRQSIHTCESKIVQKIENASVCALKFMLLPRPALISSTFDDFQLSRFDENSSDANNAQLNFATSGHRRKIREIPAVLRKVYQDGGRKAYWHVIIERSE